LDDLEVRDTMGSGNEKFGNSGAFVAKNWKLISLVALSVGLYGTFDLVRDLLRYQDTSCISWTTRHGGEIVRCGSQALRELAQRAVSLVVMMAAVAYTVVKSVSAQAAAEKFAPKEKARPPRPGSKS
jgi:hypothetical protein